MPVVQTSVPSEGAVQPTSTLPAQDPSLSSNSFSSKGLDASLLTITKNPSPPEPNFDNLIFGHKFTPHMLTVKWTKSKGWSAPEIRPHEDLRLSPASTVLHYGSALFEGMKAYRTHSNPEEIRLFRPDKNMERMNRSAQRAALPTFDGQEFIKCLRELIKLDRDHVPFQEGHSLYIRPTLIGTQDTLGMGAPQEALLFCICSPVGPYYPTGFKPVSLLAMSNVVRAWPGGTGCYKLAANYTGAVVPARQAQEQGYSQVLWLFGQDHQLTEVGAMNLFCVFRKQVEGEEGETYEVATASLDDGTILPGVTRDSILSLLRSHASGQNVLAGLPDPSKVEINERKIVMSEIVEAVQQGRLVEVFGCGTAAIVCSVDRIGYEGVDLSVPVQQDGFGDFSRTMLEQISGRQVGKISHPEWSVIC
ncbi:branched-chain amino acid aminotransferase II [Violaceomyces palustris]|uniref:Branched-chain amino acid aminotransferase II n=1 Tax=Violaceomyces palustris TaxID=1673888 RepID=A0ACD0NYK0_9BASI|nr:branched-chain amino acid aminotransferase II [Violaceomyces palustris]